MNSIITIKNLNYKDILKNINMNIKENQLVAISGSNKCGKTTLIKILSGLLESKETILLEKHALSSLSQNEVDKKVGFVIPSINMPFLFKTVEQELKFILNDLEADKENRKKRYQKIVSIFKLRGITKKDPNQLYPFLKIKVLLALAVIKKPKVLLLDDIFAILRPKEIKEIIDILNVLKKELTIIMTTNHLEQTLYCDYLYILNEGSIVLKGLPLEVLQEDSLLNKMGLSLPFMVDLSLKLKYYELLDKIELDMDRMVNTLWK